MVEHLRSKCEVLSSNPRTTTTEKKEREREREREKEHISIPLTPGSMTDTIRAQVLHTEPRTLAKNTCMFLSLVST
jgi:hypothetical protein